MKRLISIGLFLLLLYHTLGYVLVLFSAHWQEERDLSARLTMYRTVDSLVEFFVPLQDQTTRSTLTSNPAEGFSYKGSFYQVVRLEVSGDTLHILGYEDKARSFWQRDLLAFIQDQVTGDTGATQKRANHLLKNLLKEYSPFRRSVIWFFLYDWRESRPITALISPLLSRISPVHSPPPESI